MSVAPDFLPRIKRDERMSRHTSWHVGGPAETFFAPRDRRDLTAFLQNVPQGTPIYWVGLGSNLLVRDGGLRGVVIATPGALERLERRNETLVYCEAGVACARLAKQCIRWGLGPAEFFAGIPGTLGGALAMNAGAFGGETWAHVVELETIDDRGHEHTRSPREYEVGYRHVRHRAATEEGFLAATLRFERKPAANPAEVRSLLARRKASQPIGAWSCGSVFKNPAGDHAARLIEAAGLKGYRSGDASVSEKHANFIINHGAATAADIERLIGHIQAEVQRLHGVRLSPEVRIVGEGSTAVREESTPAHAESTAVREERS
ncbi:MAG TPA: UDP-N-acetylmuramate dehydrogenase [Steroidobacteraceae bacterium]|nr:UDP-N-acetylmuramate dehydrogenase [Steroidobacteraceae bacterium]